ncbi:DJ-1/PfpI family protein [Rhodococcus sp. PAM 2766]|uniref:DJ-1/PfpI family protein n=1 Tax=Rhodococcus parequi TaxID=3137122 RepID=A0ABW9FBD4_9NOCA
MGKLTGKRFALLLTGPASAAKLRVREAVEDELTGAGAAVDRVQGSGLDASSYDGLLALGGRPDTTDPIIAFVRAFFAQGKPVAVLGEAVHLLLDAGVLRNRTVSCTESLRPQILDAGANCVAYPVVADHGLVTGASADDAQAFATRTITEFALAPENPHDPRSTAPP